MKKLDQLHTKAMEIAQKAFITQKNGNEKEFMELSKQAFFLEKQAAMLLENKYETEPNRSILFKSAACLAFDAKEYGECKNMIYLALLGKPPIEIKEELCELDNEIPDKRLNTKNEYPINKTNVRINKKILTTQKVFITN